MPTDSTQDCTDKRVLVTAFPARDCSGCVPSVDDQIVLQIFGAPECVSAAVLMNDVPVASRVFELKYNVNTPNGPLCGPTCQESKGTWEIP
ncbi:MAG TPA: hypothetical protein PK156_30150 [Polyangium sp.]|nr:hypothetical protein [Polyangium sp.]